MIHIERKAFGGRQETVLSASSVLLHGKSFSSESRYEITYSRANTGSILTKKLAGLTSRFASGEPHQIMDLNFAEHWRPESAKALHQSFLALRLLNTDVARGSGC